MSTAIRPVSGKIFSEDLCGSGSGAWSLQKMRRLRTIGHKTTGHSKDIVIVDRFGWLKFI